MPSSHGIGELERLELHVGEVDLARRGNFLIEAAIAQVAITAFDRTVVHALEAGDSAATRMTAHGTIGLSDGRLWHGLAFHRVHQGSKVITGSLDRADSQIELATAAPIPARRPR
jgi:hypothetical protein